MVTEETSKRIQRNNEEAKAFFEEIEKIIRGDYYNNGEPLEHRLEDIQMALDEYYKRTCEYCENADEKGECKLGLDKSCTSSYTPFFIRKPNEEWHVTRSVWNDKDKPYLTTNARDAGIFFTGTYDECRKVCNDVQEDSEKKTNCKNCRKYKECSKDGGYLDTIMEEGLYPDGKCYDEANR